MEHEAIFQRLHTALKGVDSDNALKEAQKTAVIIHQEICAAKGPREGGRYRITVSKPDMPGNFLRAQAEYFSGGWHIMALGFLDTKAGKKPLVISRCQTASAITLPSTQARKGAGEEAQAVLELLDQQADAWTREPFPA